MLGKSCVALWMKPCSIWCFLLSKRLFITTRRRLFLLFSLAAFGIWRETLKHVYYVAKRHCVHPSPHLHLPCSLSLSFPFFFNRILSTSSLPCLYPIFTLSTISRISYIYYVSSLSFHNPGCTSCFQSLPLLGYFFPVLKSSFSLFLLSISFICFVLLPLASAFF